MPQHPYMCTPAPAAVATGVGAANLVGGSNGIGPLSVGVNGGMSDMIPGAGSVMNVGNMPIVDELLYNAATTINQMNMEMERMRQLIQTLHAEFQECANFMNNFSQNMDINLARETETKYSRVLTSKNALVHEIARICSVYDTTQKAVIKSLTNWQRNQALAGNGAPFRNNLDEIQRCIEMLVETVCKIISYINMLMLVKFAQGDDESLNTLLHQIRHAQQFLVSSAFIVDRQPPQVMKTNTKFAASVRWLIGPQLGVHCNCPTVECIILSEAQAQRHFAQRSMGELFNIPSSSGEIQNHSGSMEYQQQSRMFSASFRNMQLKKIKRAEKKGTESVMDEKFTLFFYTSTVANDLRIQVWTLSLPVVVIVHGNQEPQSWATITWDNAFSDVMREPFQVPDRVSWSQLALALKTKFTSATGRSLTDENINFLYEKLFRNDAMVSDHKDISWAQFCKEPLPDRTFTFWDWFYAIMKLTKDHLLGLWKAGLIIGFINKRRTTEDYLRLTRTGTFLLRFSDSELGGITVAFVDENGQVLMLSPWTAKDLQIRGLADRIHDLQVLRWLYPRDIPRDEAFGEFYSHRAEEQTTRDGYVANTIRAHVPAIEGGPLNATPQHHMQSPNPQEMHMSNNVNNSNVNNSNESTYIDDIVLLLNGNINSNVGVADIADNILNDWDEMQ